MILIYGRCTPPAYFWDKRIPDGYCQVDATPVSTLLSCEFLRRDP